MIEVPFDRKSVKVGDLLCFAGHPDHPLRFKFMAHDSDVVATWVEPLADRPHDVIARQKELRMLRHLPQEVVA